MATARISWATPFYSVNGGLSVLELGDLQPHAAVHGGCIPRVYVIAVYSHAALGNLHGSAGFAFSNQLAVGVVFLVAAVTDYKHLTVDQRHILNYATAAGFVPVETSEAIHFGNAPTIGI